jgi:hypothetical protein
MALEDSRASKVKPSRESVVSPCTEAPGYAQVYKRLLMEKTMVRWLVVDW